MSKRKKKQLNCIATKANNTNVLENPTHCILIGAHWLESREASIDWSRRSRQFSDNAEEEIPLFAANHCQHNEQG